MLEAVTNAHARGIPCAIITTRRAVIRPIELLQVDRVLPLHDDRTEAEAWLALVAACAEVTADGEDRLERRG